VARKKVQTESKQKNMFEFLERNKILSVVGLHVILYKKAFLVIRERLNLSGYL